MLKMLLFAKRYLRIIFLTLWDCAIIIRRGGGGAEKLERGALHKIAAKIVGGLKVKSLIGRRGGGGLKFYSKCK